MIISEIVTLVTDGFGLMDYRLAGSEKEVGTMRHAYLVGLILLFGSLVFAEYQSMTGSNMSEVYRSYRPTTDDLYKRSYDLVLGQSAGSPVATSRSAEYRAQYEVCDRDHNCFTVTREPEPQKNDDRSNKKHEEPVATKPPFFLPAWQ